MEPAAGHLAAVENYFGVGVTVGASSYLREWIGHVFPFQETLILQPTTRDDQTQGGKPSRRAGESKFRL